MNVTQIEKKKEAGKGGKQKRQTERGESEVHQHSMTE